MTSMTHLTRNPHVTWQRTFPYVGVILTTTFFISGCGPMSQRVEETKARGKIEAGGYSWSIHAESPGGNTVSAHGLPSRQHATDASTILCNKHGRIAQFVRQRGSLVLGVQVFDFNCVR